MLLATIKKATVKPGKNNKSSENNEKEEKPQAKPKPKGKTMNAIEY